MLPLASLTASIPSILANSTIVSTLMSTPVRDGTLYAIIGISVTSLIAC